MKTFYLEVKGNLGKISCDRCLFCERYQDMGASWLVCTLHTDLGDATKAVDDNKGKICPFGITLSQLKGSVMFPNNEEVIKYEHK